MYGMQKPSLTARFDLRLTAEHKDRLIRLRKRTEASSYAEVMRQALKEYETLLNKRKS